MLTVDGFFLLNMYNELGNPIRYKARLVARGFTQKYQVDYDETLLALAVQYNLKVHQIDVNWRRQFTSSKKQLNAGLKYLRKH